LGMVDVVQDYVDTVLPPASRICLPTQQGSLNHFEVDVSQTKIEVYGTPFSADGKNFEQPQQLFSADVNLGFARGYVTISTHNQASEKYASLDSWSERWDNVGFDGPVIDNEREFEIGDALVPHDGELNVGYRVADVSAGPSDTLHFKDVNLENVAAALLTFSAWYPPHYGSDPPFEQYVLKYRLNGGAWQDRMFDAGELSNLDGGNCQGALDQTIDLTVTDLVAGDNSLEFVSEKVGQAYPAVVANIDLVLRAN
ncbi:MAG TPA: hypothetical protein VGP93_08385, partial [Polyangiaceae bacterium]|nr:hypothetical protein [Polyangiaceae bacterium]